MACHSMTQLSFEKIYEVIELINSGPEFSESIPSADAILSSIEKSFSSNEPMHAQNFLNFVADEFEFFSKCRNFFERAKSLCTILMNSDQLSSKIVGVTAQTKLWLQQGQKTSGIEQFANFLFTNANDSNNHEVPPHLRTIYSDCLLELYHANPDFVKIPYEQLIDAANSNLIPNAFPEIAYASQGKTQQLDEFLNKRWWSLSPFESAVFSPSFVPNFPLPPNDPLLVHEAMCNNSVPKETALSLINSPLSQYGVAPVLLGFKDAYSLDGDTLFSPFDNDEQIAAKSQLLPPNVKSIESNPRLIDFVNHSPDSLIVSAVFSIAARFDPQDLFIFFRKFFEKTEPLDNHWERLYSAQEPKIQATLRIFLEQFPNRVSSAHILLKTDNPPYSIIENVHDVESVNLIKAFSSNQGNSLGAYSLKKLNSLQNSDNQELKEAAATKADENSEADSKISQQSINNQNYNVLDDQFIVEDRTASTTGQNKTVIVLTIKYKPAQPIYGCEFTLSNNEYFEADGVTMISSMTDYKQVRFEMKPLKAGNCYLSAYCTYTKANGETFLSNLDKIKITADEFMSPHEAEFSTVWNEGEESRLILQHTSFPSFVDKINDVVFGRVAERQEEGHIHAVVITPDGFIVAFKAEAVGNNIVNMSFKAPSIEILSLIDEFLRGLFDIK